MQDRSTCLKPLRLTTCFVGLLALAAPLSADIYEWEYIDPLQPELGKQQSTTVAPGGAGVDPVPGENLDGLDLSRAYLIGVDLTGASLYAAILTDADLTNAVITSVDLTRKLSGNVISADQLYSTLSYQVGDLSGITLTGSDLSGWKLANLNLSGSTFVIADLSNGTLSGSNLTDAVFGGASLTNTDFSGTVLSGASLGFTTSSGFTQQQLASSLSYQSGNLTGLIIGDRNDLSGWDFSNQDLTGADFSGAMNLAGTDFTGAIINNAHFSKTTTAGFTEQQLAATASYQAGDLVGIDLRYNNLSGWDLTEQDLTGALLDVAALQSTDFTDATITNASFSYTVKYGLTMEQLAVTANFKAGNLWGVNLGYNDLTGWDLSDTDLTGADFSNARLNGADLSNAVLVNANLGGSAALADADLRAADLTGAGFPHAKLIRTDMRDAVFTGAGLAGASLIGTDTRGAVNLTEQQIAAANWHRCFVRPDGTMREGMVPAPTELISIRDDDGFASRAPIPITVQNAFDIKSTATLRILLEDADWGSTILFDASVGTAYLGGTLELVMQLDEGLTPADLLGATFQLFDWTGVTIDGGFDDFVLDPAWFAAGLSIDRSQLMTTGEVRVVPLIGDLDGDGFVGIADLNIVLSHWNLAVPSGSLLSGDLNGDGFVGIEDLNAVLGTWNSQVPAPAVGSAVPEPGGAALLGIAAAATITRRRMPVTGKRAMQNVTA